MADIQPRGLSRGLTNYGDADFSLYLRRSFASSMGYSREMLDRPIVGICHSASGFNNCHRHVPEMIEAVKRGVLSSGALPIEFPTISLGELFLVPTSLKFPQPHVDGCRGDDPRSAHGRGDSCWWLRQDGTCPAHGCGIGRSTDDTTCDRTNVDEPPSWRTAWGVHRL